MPGSTVTAPVVPSNAKMRLKYRISIEVALSPMLAAE
jgi:hypothetical protein